MDPTATMEKLVSCVNCRCLPTTPLAQRYDVLKEEETKAAIPASPRVSPTRGNGSPTRGNGSPPKPKRHLMADEGSPSGAMLRF